MLFKTSNQWKFYTERSDPWAKSDSIPSPIKPSNQFKPKSEGPSLNMLLGIALSVLLLAIIVSTIASKSGDTLIETKRIEDLIAFMNQSSHLEDARVRLENRLYELESSIKKANEGESQEFRARYRAKVPEMDKFADELGQYLNDTVKTAEHKEALEREIQQIREEIEKKREEKERIEERIGTIQDLLRTEFQRNGVGSEADLDDLIRARKLEVNKIRNSTMECEEEIRASQVKITALIREYEELKESLVEIEHQIGLRGWISDVLGSISKFELIRSQIKTLQDNQLRQGRDNMTELIQSLGQKERELNGLILEALEKKVITKEEMELISDTSKAEEIKGNNSESISKATVVNRAKVLRLYIRKEQDLLKAWGQYQFDTLKLSQREQKEITATIDNLKRKVENSTEELETLGLEKKEKELRIVRITEMRVELRESVEKCEKFVNETRILYELEEAEMNKLLVEKEKIYEINRELLREKSLLMTFEEKSGVQDLMEKIEEIEDKVRRLREIQYLGKDKLGDFIESINSFILKRDV